MRKIIRRSKLASWSRRLGSIALPILVLSIFMHRSSSIITETFQLILSISFIIAFLALISGTIALIQLWFSGDKGWSRALMGVFLALFCLSPLVFASIEAQKYPNISDISTNPELNLTLISNIQRPNAQKIEQQELLKFFPNLIARNYQLDAKQLYDLVKGQISKNRWKIIKTQNINTSSKQINAIEMTLLGWRDEIVILILDREHGSTIAMRSASKIAKNDLGKNGKRIEAFLLNLDEAVTKYDSNMVSSELTPTPATKTKN